MLSRESERLVAGHAYDPADLERRLIVELLLDGEPAGLQRAEHIDAGLSKAGIHDGCHGFRFVLPADALPHIRRIGVRIANLEPSLHREIEAGADPVPATPGRLPVGAVIWPGGLRLTGWVRRPGDGSTPLVEAFLDGERLAFARADSWREVEAGGASSVEPGFALVLPRFLADGAARRIEVRVADRALEGSPVAILAFADGLEAELAARPALRDEAARGRLFDLACPDAVPFAEFEAWDARFFPAPAGPRLGKPLAIAAIGAEADGRHTLESPALGLAAGRVGAILAGDGGPTRFDAGEFVRFLEGPAAACPIVFVLLAGAVVRAGAPARLMAALEADPLAEIAYGDLLFEAGDGSFAPLMLPAFDEERFREQGAPGLAFAMKRGPAIKAARRGIEADILLRPEASLPAIRIRRKTTTRPSVTILLDAATHAGIDVEASLAALETTRARGKADVVVIGRDLSEEVLQRLALDGVAVHETAEGEGSSARLAAAVERAEGDLLCLLDARLRPRTADWLEELMGRLSDPRTGAVAPLIASTLGGIVEAGRVLRPAGRAVFAFRDRMAGDAGTGDALHVARQVSALDRGCLLVRRSDFLAVGGFDPQLFPDAGGEVDFCLKLRALGRRLVVTPDAQLVLPAAPEETESSSARHRRERAERVLFARWPEAFAADPFYSPLLDRGPVPYSGLAWPPGPAQARRAIVQPARSIPPGW